MKPNFSFRSEVFYGVRIYVFLEKERFVNYLRELDLEEVEEENIEAADGYTVHYTNKDKDVLLIYLSNDDYFVLVHECLHLAYYVLDIHGIKVDASNHEALTYMQEYLMKEIIKRKQKCTIKIKDQ